MAKSGGAFFFFSWNKAMMWVRLRMDGRAPPALSSPSSLVHADGPANYTRQRGGSIAQLKSSFSEGCAASSALWLCFIRLLKTVFLISSGFQRQIFLFWWLRPCPRAHVMFKKKEILHGIFEIISSTLNCTGRLSGADVKCTTKPRGVHL